MKLNPLTIRKIKRFKSIKRGYFSFWIFIIMLVVSLFAEVLVNNRALIVHYEGKYYFPTYRHMLPGTNFGQDYEYETDYRELAARVKAENSGNWVLLPAVPFNSYENDLKEDAFPPFPPSAREKHYLGTDAIGRDIVARLVYGFRIAIAFSLLLLVANYAIGVSIGSAMGFWGGEV